jgi:hypothetical protein
MLTKLLIGAGLALLLIGPWFLPRGKRRSDGFSGSDAADASSPWIDHHGGSGHGHGDDGGGDGGGH